MSRIAMLVRMLVVLGGLACRTDVRAPAQAQAPLRVESSEVGDQVGFWTDATEYDADRVGIWEEFAGGSKKLCRPRHCPTAAFVDEQLRSATRPVKTGACVKEVPTLCAAATRSGEALARCRDRLLGKRELGTVQGSELLLSPRGAALVASSANSIELDRVALENSADATALAASAMVAGVIDESGPASGWCSAVADGIAAGGKATVLGPALTCLAHATMGLPETKILARWPGCGCGERGRLLDTACIEGHSVSRPFAEAPIDSRLPDAMRETVRRANLVLAQRGWTLDGIGLLGCHILRFERGGNTRGLVAQASPRISAGDVSGHSAAVSCDLMNLWIEREAGAPEDSPEEKGRIVAGYSVEMAFWSMADPSGARHVYDKRALIGEFRQRVDAAGGEGPLFRAIEATPATVSKLARREVAVYAFAVLRNALVDAGFVVYTPATNHTHYNHLHFHLPANPDVWRETAADETSSVRRDQIVEVALARASGREAARPSQ